MGFIFKKTRLFISWSAVPRNRPKFWITASVLRGKLFENLEICWMSDKTVIEFTLVLCEELCWSRRLVSSICIISHFIRKPNSIIVTVGLHEPRHLEEDYPITRVVFENKRFPSFFASGPINFKVQLCKPVKILKPFELIWPLRKQPSNLCMLLLRLRKKKLESLLFSKKVAIG